jgi:flagellin
MVVAHNLFAENATRYNVMNKAKLSKSLEKLSSGYRINRAGDDAAGLAVSEKMRAQIRGIEQAVSNAGDGISMIQTFEGALEETHKILGRMKTLAVQSSNGTYDDQVDRAAIELEYEQLCSELDDIANTDFNGVVVLATHSTTEKREPTGVVLEPAITEKALKDTTQKMGVNHAPLNNHKLDKYVKVTVENGEITSPGWTLITRNNTTWVSTPIEWRYNGSDQRLYTATTTNGTIEFIVPKPEVLEYKVTRTETENPTSVSLQVGSRTKDLKTYDFNYRGVWSLDPTLEQKAIGELNANIDVTAEGLGLYTSGKYTVNLSTQTSANTAIDSIDFAINKISMVRGTFGSIQNRLEHKIDNLNSTDENLTASESRIRDTDMATEVVNLSKMQILMQASQAMLAQANQLPQSVMSLLQ